LRVARPADWTFASGNAAAREGRMLPEGFFRDLLAESVPDGLLRRAGETVLRERVRTADDLYDVEHHAEEVWEELLQETRDICPTPLLADLFELEREFRSLKSYIKRTRFGLKADPVPTRYGDAEWEAVWNGYAPEVPQVFHEAARDAQQMAREAPDRADFMDSSLDVVCLAALRDVADRCGSPFIAEYFRHYDAVKGVEMLWRARQAGVDESAEALLWERRQEHDLFLMLSQAEEENWLDIVGSAFEGLQVTILDEGAGFGRLRAFVRAADEWLMAHARAARSVAFGPERVFGYLIGMRAELQDLKVALAGRALGVPGQVLAGRLRAVYV
jgi:V/A-type H+-transporting ATPase subunit C